MTSPKKDKTKEEKKKIAILLSAIGIIIFFFLWRFVFSTPTIEEELIVMPVRKTVPLIDFQYLKTEQFDEFVKYETIPAIDVDELGRENPFDRY